LLAHKRKRHAVKEHKHAKARNVRADRGNEIPTGECIGVVDIAARHARHAEEMLREEGDVDADEGEPEVQLAERLAVHVAGYLREPVIPAAEDGEDGSD